MREIIFRGWDKREERMFKIPALNFKEKIVYEVVEIGTRKYEFDRIEIMMFTGLKDKNGKEIYEKDIIIDCLGEGNERIGLVLWGHSGGFDWFIPENIYSVNFENIDLDEWDYAEYSCRDFSALVGRNRFEVIGNIYENPELLEKVQQ